MLEVVPFMASCNASKIDFFINLLGVTRICCRKFYLPVPRVPYIFLS